MNEDYTEEDLVANLPQQSFDQQIENKRIAQKNSQSKISKKQFIQEKFKSFQISNNIQLNRQRLALTQNYFFSNRNKQLNNSGYSTPAHSEQKQLSIFSSDNNSQQVKTNDMSVSAYNSYSQQFFPTLVDVNDRKSIQSSSTQSIYYEKPQQQQSQKWKKFKRQFSSQIDEQKEKLLLSQLLDQSPEQHIKEVVKQRINGQEIPNLSTHLKYIDKINDVNQFSNESISNFSSMINTSYSQCLATQKLGIINDRNQPQNNVNAKHFQIGDRRIEIFSIGIQSFKDVIERLNLSNNHISDKGASILFQRISKKTYQLDLSYNKLSINACTQLVNLMTNSNYSLKEINLEGNNLGNAAGLIIIQGCIKPGNSIVKLNLSKNNLNEKICPQIKQLLSSNQDLAELYLHWNLFGTNGGRLIAEGLMINVYLKVLDISHNKMGQNIENTKIWCSVLERDSNMELIHLDLSFNDFTYEECKMISVSLDNNHTIYGFHFQGQYGQTDIKGFLKIPETTIIEEKRDAWFVQHRIDSTRAIKSNGLKDNCWICGGWEERTFSWEPDVSGPVNQDPIFIHFSIDDYMPHLMVKNDYNDVYQFTKVFPPGQKIYYLFTGLGYQLIANDQKQEAAKDSQIEIHFVDTVIHCEMEYFNVAKTNTNPQFFTSSYQSQYKCKPREVEINYLLPKKEILKQQWTYETSIFKDWKKDDTELLDKCFNIDWDKSRIERIVKNKEEIPEFKEFLRSKYKDIKDCYKSNASLAPAGEVWSLNQNVFGDFVQQAQIVDNQILFLKDADFQFISSNSQQGGASSTNKNNPARQLIRYQFLEVLVRLCDDKYIKTKKCATYIDAFRQMLYDGLQEALDSIDSEQDWRNKYYWTEQSDICMRYYKPLIDYVYRKYAGTKNNDLVKVKYLNLEEFKTICYTYGFVSDKVTERDLNLAFNLSMMTQPDEINKNRHLQMHVIEFMEALARLADQLSPIPYGFEQETETWNPDMLQNLDISIKTEKLLSIMFSKIKDKVLQQEFKMPESSLFKDEIQAIMNGKEQQLQGRKAIRKNTQNTDINGNKKLNRMQSRVNSNGSINNSNNNIKRSISKKFSVISQLNSINQRQSIVQDRQSTVNSRQSIVQDRIYTVNSRQSIVQDRQNSQFNSRQSIYKFNNQNHKNQTVIIMNPKQQQNIIESQQENSSQFRNRQNTQDNYSKKDRYSVSNIVNEIQLEKDQDSENSDYVIEKQ